MSADLLPVARALYDATRADDTPAWDRLQPWQHRDWLSAARAAVRRCNPLARQVGVELAAGAYAQEHEWVWPSLENYSPRESHVDPVLARIELRQRIRYLAHVVCKVYDEHLHSGGIENRPHFEEECVRLIAAQRADDAEQRKALKPKPRLLRHPIFQAYTESDPRD